MTLAGGAAWGQGKPLPQGQSRPALPTAKPPALGAPMQAQPAPAPRPPIVQAPPVSPPPVAQAPGGKPGLGAPGPAAPATPPPAATAPGIPAGEPAAIARLRGLLGSEVRLSYAGVQAQDAAGEQVRMTGVVLEQGSKRATADEVTISGLREDGVLEAVITGFGTREGGSDIRIGRLRIAGLTVPRGAGGPPDPAQVRLEALSVEGVQATGAAPVSLRSATLENWIAGQPVRFAMDGLEVGGIDGGFVDTLRLARVALSGVDIGGTISAVMRGERPPNLVGRATMDLDRLELLGGGRAVGGLGEMRIAADIARADGSGAGAIAFRGIRVEPLPMIAEWMTRFGYPAIEGEITAATTFDAQTGRVEVRDFTVAGRDAGTLTFSIALDGVTQERAQAGDFAQMRLISMALGYADSSLFQRFVAMQARQSGATEAQLREQFAAMAGGALSQPGAGGLDPIRDAVTSFIRGQARSVAIRVNPPAPIAFSQVQGGPPPSPAEAQRMFGITAEAR